jgi:hypothetical protein
MKIINKTQLARAMEYQESKILGLLAYAWRNKMLNKEERRYLARVCEDPSQYSTCSPHAEWEARENIRNILSGNSKDPQRLDSHLDKLISAMDNNKKNIRRLEDSDKLKSIQYKLKKTHTPKYEKTEFTHEGILFTVYWPENRG